MIDIERLVRQTVGKYRDFLVGIDFDDIKSAEIGNVSIAGFIESGGVKNFV